MLAVIKNNEKKLWILFEKTKKRTLLNNILFIKSIEGTEEYGKLNLQKEKQTFQNSAD
jgi:hypothetical protein